MKRYLRAWLGNIWGMTTTLMLAIASFMASVLAIPAVHDLLVVFPWFPYLTAAVGLLGFLGRIWAPPPASVPIPEGAKATQLGERTMMIETPTALPADAVKAAAGVPDVPAAVTPEAVPA